MANAGQMIHAFTIERATTTQSTTGQPVKNWGDVTAMLTGHSTWFGSLAPTAGTEYKRAGQITGSMSHEIKGWYFPGLKVTDRLKEGTRIFNIVAALNVNETDEEYQIFAKEAV